jgi:hypothetical protein
MHLSGHTTRSVAVFKEIIENTVDWMVKRSHGHPVSYWTLTFADQYTSDNLVLNNLLCAHLLKQFHTINIWQLVFTALKPITEDAAYMVLVG